MTRQTLPLTATQVDKSKPKDKPYRLHDGSGLILNIAPSGVKTWYYKYKQPYVKKEDMYKIGRYPDISLADARKKCQECREMVAQNINPKEYFKNLSEKKSKEATHNFTFVFNEWISKKDYTPATVKKLRSYFLEILAVIGNKPIGLITAEDCMKVLTPIEQAGHHTKLIKVRSIINQVINYAITRGIATNNPVLYLRGSFKTGKIRHNPAILDEIRLAELVKAIDGYHGSFVTKNALMFTLITFARNGEVRNMTWNDINLEKDLWTYTPNKTKKSTEVQIIVPLSKQAVDILKQMRLYNQNSELVFASLVSNIRPLSENTLNQALRRLGFDKNEQTTHGFRAIARTLLEEKFEYDYRLIEMQLGHQVRDSNGRAYNRVQWLDKRREMMQRWADYLDELKNK